MKKISKILMIAITFSLAAMLTAEGKNEGGTSSDHPSGFDRGTVKFYLPGDKKADVDAVWENVSRLTEDRLNADFEVNYAPWGEFPDKIQLLLASGDDYDMNFDGAWLIYPKMVNRGGYMDITELARENMPQYYNILEERGYLESSMVDGKMMCVPWTPLYQRKPWITWNEDYYTNGFTWDKPVETMEQLDDFLTAAHKAMPDKKFVNSPLHLMTTTGWFLLPKYELAEWNYHQFSFDLNDSKVKILPLEQHPIYLETARWAQKWVKAGIIPRDCMTNYDEYVNKGKDYTIASLQTIEYAYYAADEDSYLQQDGTLNDSHKLHELYPGNKYIARSPLDNVFALNNNAANPEKALAFIDLVSTDQAVFDAAIYGIEGKTYQIRNGSYEYPVGQDQSTSTYLDWHGQWGFWRDYFIRPSGPRTAKHWEINNEYASRDNFIISPIAGFFPNTEPIKNELARRDALYEEYGKPILFGLVDDMDTAIKEYVKKQEDAGLDIIMKELQRQIDAYLGN